MSLWEVSSEVAENDGELLRCLTRGWEISSEANECRRCGQPIDEFIRANMFAGQEQGEMFLEERRQRWTAGTLKAERERMD